MASAAALCLCAMGAAAVAALCLCAMASAAALCLCAMGAAAAFFFAHPAGAGALSSRSIMVRTRSRIERFSFPNFLRSRSNSASSWVFQTVVSLRSRSNSRSIKALNLRLEAPSAALRAALLRKVFFCRLPAVSTKGPGGPRPHSDRAGFRTFLRRKYL